MKVLYNVNTVHAYVTGCLVHTVTYRIVPNWKF